MAKRPERMEDLPPKIQEALKRKGWTYPPDERMKREWREAAKRAAGMIHIDPEVLEMAYEEDRPSWWIKLKNNPEAYRRWKEEATKRYQQWKTQQEKESDNAN